MPLTKHSATQGTGSSEATVSDVEAQLVVMVSSELKWAFKAIATRKQMTAKRLLVQILHEYVAREHQQQQPQGVVNAPTQSEAVHA